MGQIVGGAAKPKRCNLNKLSQFGTPAAGEHILVSSDNSMNAAGQGDFDAYVKGDGVTPATELELKSLVDDGAFDISAYRATGNVLAKYADIAAALDGGNNIPKAFRKGGMSVKFVQSSDNKYVQYFLTKDEWSSSEGDWEKMNLEVEVSQLRQEVDNIDEAIDAKTTSEVVSERIPYIQNDGYINQWGKVVGSYQYSMTDPILLKAGESLKMKAITPSGIARLASYNPDTQQYTVILLGESAGISSADNAYENTYTATDDIYVVVSYYWQWYSLELTKIYTKVTTTSALDGIGVMENVLEIEHDTDTVTEDIPLTIVTGKYYFGQVGVEARDSPNAGYNRSEPFIIRGGDTVYINAIASAASVAVFSVKDGEKYRCYQIGGTGDREITYTAPFETLGIVSFEAGTTPTVKRTRTNDDYDSARLHRLEEMEGTVAELQQSVEETSGRVDDLGNMVKTVITDDLTTGTEDKSINHAGSVSETTSFGIKEFDVLAGTVIVYKATIHPLLAAIAKKIDATHYEELVPATAFSEETFNYTVTEDMTVAFCFKADTTRSVVITTGNVHSNRLNIEKLKSYKDESEIRKIDLGFLFNKIAVIGDSMSVATMDGYTGPLGASWLSFLAKRWACVNKDWYAKGGTTTYQWLNDTNYGLGKFLADENIYNCYFIAYGHNDSMDAGQAADEAAPVTITDGVPSCPDGLTFCAYYKAIINQIRTKAPHAMIFCLSQYDYSVAPGGWNQDNGQAVVDVAEWYYNNGDKLVHHLDTGGVPISNMDIGGHYSTIGYAYIAKRINDEANKVIYQYRADTEIKTFGVYNL